jgi:hypothetical protein
VHISFYLRWKKIHLKETNKNGGEQLRSNYKNGKRHYSEGVESNEKDQ